MNRFAYRVRYVTDPPRAGRIPLADDQIRAVLSKFKHELPGHLAEDPSARVSSEPYHEDRNTIRIVVATTLNVAKTDEAVQMCAKTNDLSAMRILAL